MKATTMSKSATTIHKAGEAWEAKPGKEYDGRACLAFAHAVLHRVNPERATRALGVPVAKSRGHGHGR